MKIAYILPAWPAKDENAILNQIVELKKNGLNNLYFFSFSTNIKKDDLLILEYKKYGLTKNIIYLKQPELKIIVNKFFTKVIIFFRALPYLTKTFFYSRKVFYNALFKKDYGEYKKAFKIIYLIQPLLYKTFSFDIIHCHYAPNGIWGAILKDLGFLNGKLVTTFHGYGINKLPAKKNQGFYDFLIKKADFYTSNSNFTKSNAIKLGFPENKIHIIRIALDTKKYKFSERHFNSKEKFNVLTVAALRNVKGLEYSIMAIKLIIRQNHQIKINYKIAGEGYLKEKLENLIMEYDLEKYVELLGFVEHENLKKIYDDSHLFILPSVVTSSGNQEAQGLVLQEAQACGIPVIGTNTGGISEGIEHGKSGFIIKEKSSKEIAEKILFFYNNPEKIIEFGKEGRKFVEKKFNIHTEAQKLIELYQKHSDN